MKPAVRWAVAPNPSPMTLDGTRTYIVGREKPAVVDPGPDIPAHVRSVLAILGGATPCAIVVTHLHSDHAGAAPTLSLATGTPIWLAAAATSSPFPSEVTVHATFEGEEAPTDDGILRIVSTPGHTPEHLCIQWVGGSAPGGGGLFVGDLLLGEGDTTFVGDPEGDVADYLRSLDRIESLGSSILYPAHGDPLVDPLAAIARFRGHRLERIAQVRRALREQPDAKTETLVARLYGHSLDSRLRVAAAASVRASIRYLSQARNDQPPVSLPNVDRDVKRS